MTFKDVIIKNLIKGSRKYLSFLFSGLFCIAMFFIYSTLLLMDSVMNGNSQYPMEALFIVTCFIIGIFSIFFISYSMNNFVTNKKKELGTYMILGMNEKKVFSFMLIETLIVFVGSLVGGLITGSIFSRMFQLILVRIIGADDSGYKLSPINYFVTAVVFAIIYIISFMLSMKALKNEDLTTVIKAKKAKQYRTYKRIDSIFAVIGVVLIVFSIVFVSIVAPDNSINSKPWVIATLILSSYSGLFLTIANGGRFVIHLISKSPKYYKNMLSVKGIEYKYNSNLKIIIVLSFLASMIILLTGSPIALVSISEDIACEYSYDIEYATFGNYDEAEIDEIINRKTVKDIETESYLYIKQDDVIKPVVSTSYYNEKYNADIVLTEGEIYNLITNWVPGNNGVAPGSVYSFETDESSWNFTVKESIKNEWNTPNLFNSGGVLIVSDVNYEELKKELKCVSVNIVTFEDGWKDTEIIVEDLTDTLGDENLVNSRITNYKELKHGYATFLFVTGTMCIMFFISSGFVMYFKHYNDIDDDREKYKQMYYLGIKDNIIKSFITKKIAVAFFAPVIGTIPGFVFMYYMASLFGGGDIVKSFMDKSPIGLICYLLSQTIFFIVLKIRYEQDVMREVLE